ncbi:TPA: hypothetical protein ACXDAY_002298 [Clostridium botulinum]|uniref:hypothetical protein n=1 Tax=Clostridium botulinum TaxID=1491 RepID=UPI000AD4D527|nr:hypothetical protein [Clostridium botulinum]NFA34719.1 hypothetical protein [Clostridium botulinum]NFA82719.1 hypothetical protein [Clostridium botulinum]NFB64532.1 hypothetical protein [Clostridium botulinum]NFB84570.1 hypothetical protein [Clostridium botulinum]NFC02173.1 hypothetical protein [Clostridium botulinum]
MKVTSLNEFMKIANEKGLKLDKQIIIDDYIFLNKEVKTLKEKGIAHTIFTLVCENDECLVVQGLYKINRIGHIVIKENITIPAEGLVY